MKKFYQTVTMRIGSDDEWVEYEGEDLNEAVKKRDNENRHNCDPGYHTETRILQGKTLDDAILRGEYNVLLEEDDLDKLIEKNREIIEHFHRAKHYNTKLRPENCGLTYYIGYNISDAPEVSDEEKDCILNLAYGLEKDKTYIVDHAELSVYEKDNLLGTIDIYSIYPDYNDDDDCTCKILYFAPSNFRVR